MKSLIVNLHNAARRYCMDKYQYWMNKYSVLISEHGSSSPTEEAEDLYPRYNVLKAILDEVEKYTPADFSSLEEARKLISLAGRDAESVLTKNPDSLIKKSR